MNGLADNNDRSSSANPQINRCTIAELRALVVENGANVLSQDRWLKARMFFLMLVAISYLLKLIFFRDIALTNFNIPGGADHAVKTYMNWRITSAGILMALYSFSYVRCWHFSAVSWIAVVVAISALISDYFNVYVMISATAPQWMFGLLALRFAVIACLMLNAISARKLFAKTIPR